MKIYSLCFEGGGKTSNFYAKEYGGKGGKIKLSNHFVIILLIFIDPPKLKG